MWFRRSLCVILFGGNFAAAATASELEALTAEVARVRLEASEAWKEVEMLRRQLNESAYRTPTSGDKSLYVDKDDIVDIGARDIQGGPGQKDKRVSVDDVLFGYDVLFEDRQLFAKQRWRGMAIQQDPNDAFVIQDFLWTERPDTMIEFGTHRGGSAVFYAEVMTAYNPNAHIITIDVTDWVSAQKDDSALPASSSPYWGSTIRPIIGPPTSDSVRRRVADLLAEFNSTNVFVMEDSYHIFEEVLGNLLAYHRLVRPCGWILVQDTRLTRMYGHGGPIKAARTFMAQHPQFKVNRQWEYLLYTQHPQGWLQREPRGRRCPDRDEMQQKLTSR